jgi:hypothetical protein
MMPSAWKLDPIKKILDRAWFESDEAGESLSQSPMTSVSPTVAKASRAQQDQPTSNFASANYHDDDDDDDDDEVGPARCCCYSCQCRVN